MYNNYIFDLYGTLIEIETDEEKEEIWEKLSLFFGYNEAIYTPEELKTRYNKIVSKNMQDAKDEKKSEINIDDVFYKLYKEKGIKAKGKLTKGTALLFRLLSTVTIKLCPGVEETLRNLKEENKKIYIIGNGQSIFAEHEINLCGINEYFDGIYMSSNYGYKKPDIRLFDSISEVEKLKKKSSIIIGDDYVEDIGFANELGIDSLYINKSRNEENQDKIESKFAVIDGDISKILDILK